MDNKVTILQKLKRFRFIFLGIFFGTLYWIAETCIHIYFLNEGTFFEQLLFPEFHDTWTRSLMGVVIMIFSIFVQLSVNKREKTERALIESEEKWRSLVENAPNIIMTLDRNGKILFINYTVPGLSVDDIVGSNAREYIQPEYIETLMKAIEEVFQTGKSTTYEVSGTGPQGSVAYYSTRIGPIKEGGGKVVAAIQIITDITERKKAEEALRESEEKYRTLIENIPSRIFLKDTNQNYISCNENFAEDLGIASEEIAGKTDYDFFLKELADKYRADDKRILKSGKTEEIEEKYVKKGEDLWVHTIKTPVRDKKGKITGILGIFWDVTERRRNEQARECLAVELEAKNQELEDYTYTVSHDLKTPLVTIQGFAELLSTKYADQLDEKAKHYLDRITQGTDNLGRLVSNLLELSRAGRKMRPFEWHDFNEILEVSLEGLEVKLTQKDVKIMHPDDFPKVYCDDMRLDQVMSNLIGNAVNYMGEQKKPRIDIGWKENGNNYTFWVKDNGIGIREEDQDRIFKVFERAETGFDEEGSGIGLSIVKKIIQVHGGDVWVESEAGKGSTFYFTLSKKGVEE